MSDQSQGPGWWQASDGKWYAPEQHPDFAGDATAVSGQPPVDPSAPASDATAVFSTPPPVPDPAAPPVDPGPPPSSGGYPPGPPVAGGGPPLGGSAPGSGDGGDDGKKRSKAPLIIALVVLVLVILGVGGFLLLSGGDDGDEEEAEPTEEEEPEDEGEPATEEGLEAAATEYALALLADDAAAAYPHVSDECQEIVTVGEYEDIFADISESLEESDVELGDISVDDVEISDFSEDRGSVTVVLDGPGDFPVAGYVALPQEWTYDGGRWQVPGCDGVVLGWYSFDEVGFETAGTDFFNGTVSGPIDLTYPFLSEQCREEVDVDAYVQFNEDAFDEIEDALGVDLRSLRLTGLTDVEIDGDEAEGLPELDIPDDVADALEEIDGLDDFAADPLALTYEAGIWRTTECSEYTGEDGLEEFEEVGPPEDDESLNPIEGAIIPFPETARVGNWDVRVVGFEENANASIAAADPNNPTPFSGNQYVIVTLEVTYRGDGTSTPFDFNFGGLNGAGEDNSFYDACGTVPNELFTDQQVDNGQTVQGNICFDTPIEDVPTFQLEVEDFFSDSPPLIFLVR